MNFFPNFIAVLAILLPPGSGENVASTVLGSPAVERANRDFNSFYSPAHLPPASESFFECIDESALDEEESTEVVDHGISSLTFLDFETPQTSDFFWSSLPTRPRSQFVVITPIQRC